MTTTTTIKRTYFIEGTRVKGFLDTARLPKLCGRGYETMDYINHDFGRFCEEQTDDMMEAIKLHDAWTVILAHKLNAKAVDTIFMDEALTIHPQTRYIIDEFDKVS